MAKKIKIYGEFDSGTQEGILADSSQIRKGQKTVSEVLDEQEVTVTEDTQTGKTELKIGSDVALTVDKKPEVGSHNLVESGGVLNSINQDWFINSIVNNVDVNLFISELYITGLNDNVDYCLRTLRNHNGYVYLYIGTSVGSVIEYLIPTTEPYGIKHKRSDNIDLYVVLKNVDIMPDTVISSNADTTVCTLNKPLCEDIENCSIIHPDFLLKYANSIFNQSWFLNSFINDVDANMFIEELYITGLDENVNYCLRTLRKHNGNYYVYIGTNEGLVIDLLIPETNAFGVKHKHSGNIDMYVLLKNTDKWPASYISSNTDTTKCTLNKSLCENVECCPAIHAALIEQYAEEIDTHLEKVETHVNDTDLLCGLNFSRADFQSQSSNYVQIKKINAGDIVTLYLTDNKTGIGTYVYFRKDVDGSTLKNIKLPEPNSVFTFEATTEINYIKVNATESQFPGASEVTDWHRSIIVNVQKKDKEQTIHIKKFYNNHQVPKNPATLKILCIGNSYIMEPSKAIINFLSSYNITNVLYAYTYHAGASIDGYNTNFDNDWCLFSYSQNGSAFRTIDIETGEDSPADTDHYVNTPREAVEWTDWDIIMFQQASTYSDNVSHLDSFWDLIFKVKYNCKNSGVKLAWHMTWAWAATYPSVEERGGQQEMYEGIVSVAKQVEDEYGLDLIVPSGTVLQNLRAVSDNFWGEDKDSVKGITDAENYGDFTDDGSHPNSYAEYAIAAGIMQTLILPSFNKTILGTTATYGTATQGRLADMAIQCALKAVNDRYAVSVIDEG